MGKKTSSLVKYSLSFGLAAVLVYFAFKGIDWASFLDGLKLTRWGWIVIFAVTSALALVFRALRWKALLEPLDPSVKGMRIWDANNVGNLTNLVLPGSGEFVRCGYMVSGRAKFESVFGTVFMERIWDLIAIAVLFASALIFGHSRFGIFFEDNIVKPAASRFDLSLGWVVLALIVLGLTALWAVFHFRGRSRFCGRIAGVFKGLSDGFTSFLKMDRKPLFVIWTVGIWSMYILMSYSILRSMPALESLDFVDAIFLSAVGNIASIIPVPGGIGAYHYLIALTLSSLYGVSWETGILNATLNHELHAILILIFGAVSYVNLSLGKSQK